MPLPLPAPSNNVENLGPAKADRDRAPDDQHYLKSSEWNWAVEYLKMLYAAVDALVLGASSVQLQDAYNNASIGINFNPVRIGLSNILKRIVVTDFSPSIGEMLFGVSKNDGSDEYGFWAQGLRLLNSANAIHTAAGVAVQMKSGQTPASGAAFILDTATAYNTAEKIVSIQTGGGFERWSFGGTGQFYAYDPLGVAGTIQYGFEPLYDGTGAVVMRSDKPGGMTLIPQATGTGTLGRAGAMFLGTHARYHATSFVTIAYAANLAINLHNGEIQRITALPGDITITAINNAEIGADLRLMFEQDGTGARQATLPGNVIFKRPFFLSQEPNDLTVLALKYDGVDWWEVDRFQTNPPETSVAVVVLSTGTLPIGAHRDFHNISCSGLLTGNTTIEVETANAVNGDRIELIFEEVGGVTTSAANVLTIKIQGGTTFEVFNQAKTLRGRILLYHTGTTWKHSSSGITYA